MYRGESWMQYGECSGMDPEMFFEESAQCERIAKGACAMCEVASQCLERALDMNIEFGIFGGLTANQRKRLRRKEAMR